MMKVHLNKIEQLNNGAVHIVFNTEDNEQFSFTVSKAFALTACRFIVENTFGYDNELSIELTSYREHESMWILSRSINNGFETKLQITQYFIDEESV